MKAREGIAPAIAADDAAPDRGPIRISSVERVRGRVTAQARALHALSRPLWIIALCSLIGVAHLGRSALVPLALGLLVACVLSGVVETLCRYRVPRGLSASVLLVLVSLAIGGVIERHLIHGLKGGHALEEAPCVEHDYGHLVNDDRN